MHFHSKGVAEQGFLLDWFETCWRYRACGPAYVPILKHTKYEIAHFTCPRVFQELKDKNGHNRTKILNTFNANLKYQTTNIRWLWGSHAPINDFRFAGKTTKIESRKSRPNACVFYFLFLGGIAVAYSGTQTIRTPFLEKSPGFWVWRGKFQVSVFWPTKRVLPRNCFVPSSD